MWDVFVRQKAVKLTKNQTSGLEIINSSESLFHRDLALMILPHSFLCKIYAILFSIFFLQNHPMGQIKPFCGCMFVIPGISDLKNYDQCHECMCHVAVFGFGSTRT